MSNSEHESDDDEIVCDACDITFAKTNNYTRHLRNVHSAIVIEWYKCPIKHEKVLKYKYKRNLTRHLTRDHGISDENEVNRLCALSKRIPVLNTPKIVVDRQSTNAPHRRKSSTVSASSLGKSLLQLTFSHILLLLD